MGDLASPHRPPPGFTPLCFRGLEGGGELGGGKQFPPRKQLCPGFPQAAQLPLIKGNKSGSSTAGAPALELGDPLGSGPGLSLTAAAFFFFFFFFSLALYVQYVHRNTMCMWTCPPRSGRESQSG
eukprot:FR740940.1.p4 GENE.FR740940.1~~FR740940.1.p4  ORF type:complete len:125 (-),score=40.08 FR740940.1:536-910(-)